MCVNVTQLLKHDKVKILYSKLDWFQYHYPVTCIIVLKIAFKDFKIFVVRIKQRTDLSVHIV